MRNALALVLLSATVFSCQSADKSSGTSSDLVLDTTVKFNPQAVNKNGEQSSQPVQPTTASLPLNGTPALPASNSYLPASSPAVSAPAAASGKVNPEHGKPGHRCDLAVGAIIPGTATPPATNTAAASQQTPSTGATQVNISKEQIVAAANQATKAAAGKLNPEHGKPGHRCDIAVGAPLNSAPAKPAATTTQVTPTPASTATPVFQTDSAGNKLNPPHGQPGHDCTIETGKPLKK